MANQAGHLYSVLNAASINYTTIEHPPLFTVQQSKTLNLDIPGAHTKNLFLKDDKKNYWLISALQDTQINLKALSKKLPAKNLRFAKPDALKKYLGVTPGSVTWFALLNDIDNNVNAIIDKAIFNADLVGFHPLINTATTIVKPSDLIEFVKHIGHKYQTYNFTECI